MYTYRSQTFMYAHADHTHFYLQAQITHVHALYRDRHTAAVARMHISGSDVHIHLLQTCSPRTCTPVLFLAHPEAEVHLLHLTSHSTGYKYLLRAIVCQEPRLVVH